MFHCIFNCDCYSEEEYRAKYPHIHNNKDKSHKKKIYKKKKTTKVHFFGRGR